MTYQQGDMVKSRMKLALRRWAVNLILARRRGYVLLQTVTIEYITETGGPRELAVKRSIVLPSVDSVSTVVANENDGTPSRNGVTLRVTVPCHRNGSSRTRELKERRCDFCFNRYTYKDGRSRYCSDTCKQDAYQVRQAYRNGQAKEYYDTLPGLVVVEVAYA